ncbi:MAG TPA: FAD-dependent oxidoreductase [Verrucomicrobiota bacterium]|jgi:hypothetical protein|nr:FAD-dependent oxidoreductase [Verrucomicrobiota bacterium]HRT07915.1 FAD-dependent oxidoreductase [Candidatus Paceibacterota bacterium]
MKRRSFLRAAAASASCSVFINLSGWGQTRNSSPPSLPGPGAGPGAGGGSKTALFEGEPPLRLVDHECDLLVAGGGLAGVCAALAAARHGARVLLVQDRSRLGGNSSSEVKMHVVGADMSGGRPGWREGGIIEELRLEDAVHNPQRSREMWDLLLYDKVKSESNITLLLDTAVCAAEVRDGRIQRALARSDKQETLHRIAARLYADCTGDCRLGLEAGADLRTGRESRAEFGESLALEKADSQTLGSSILFTSRDFGRPMPFTPPKWARKVTKEMLRFRSVKSWEYGYWWVEWGGDLDTIRDEERIRFELLRIALGVWDYIKNSGEHPSSANWALDWLGMVPGKRGSRRLLGDYILKEQDLMGTAEPLYDGVCIGGWSMDDHPPTGFDRPEERPARQVPPPFPYNIPLRSLHSRNLGNLFMAGRNLSATHVAFTSTRVMATCAVMGQAVGTAAAYCLQHQLSPRQLSSDRQRVAELQQMLLRDDQTIMGLRNTDPLDLARQASVTASACLAESDPAHVINGLVRDLPGKLDNRWSAELGAGAHLDLEWPAPQTLRTVQITFDTGFHRPLTLTHQDSFNAKMVRGPQPETVRDYELLYRPADDAPWTSLGAVSGNYQRLRRHHFPPFTAKALRLKVTATNGSKEARVYEIRCYAD